MKLLKTTFTEMTVWYDSTEPTDSNNTWLCSSKQLLAYCSSLFWFPHLDTDHVVEPLM